MSNDYNVALLEKYFEEFKEQGYSDKQAEYLAIEKFTNYEENPDDSKDC
tara:strand:- start:1987 stop:2133 length:147 start_codon:yes stop_codon:yes gene_type:complete